jgi:hypothetical protein
MATLKESYESKIEEIEQMHDEKMQSFEEELDIYETDNNDLKMRLQENERDFLELSSNYDRDKALWEDKFEFLDNQKAQAKRDLQDAHQKFEMTVEQLQRKDSSERGKTESAQMLLINSIEKKYKDQIKDMNDSNASQLHDMSLRYKQLEKEYKELKEKYEIETRGKKNEHGGMERKLRELLENEGSYLEEIKDLKHQRDRRCLDNQTTLEKEKEQYKVKLADAETKLKNSETKRSFQIFEFEKEKAKWTLEKDKLVQEQDIITEKLRKARGKKDKLDQELTKLKNQFREHRRFMYSSNLSSSSAAKDLATKKVKMTLSGIDPDESPSSKSIRIPRSSKNYIGDYTKPKTSGFK